MSCFAQPRQDKIFSIFSHKMNYHDELINTSGSNAYCICPLIKHDYKVYNESSKLKILK